MEFGLIKYFLKIHDSVFKAISKLYITGNFIRRCRYRTSNALMELKNEGILDKFHADVEENDGILCIDSNNIVLKCIVRAFNNLICEISEHIIPIYSNMIEYKF